MGRQFYFPGACSFSIPSEFEILQVKSSTSVYPSGNARTEVRFLLVFESVAFEMTVSAFGKQSNLPFVASEQIKSREASEPDYRETINELNKFVLPDGAIAYTQFYDHATHFPNDHWELFFLKVQRLPA